MSRAIVRQRLTLIGSKFRPRSASYKGRLAAELVTQIWSLLASGRIVSHVCAVFDWRAVRDADAQMDAGEQEVG